MQPEKFYTLNHLHNYKESGGDDVTASSFPFRDSVAGDAVFSRLFFFDYGMDGIGLLSGAPC